VINAGGTIIDWNERAEKMFGWGKEEALGLELAEVIIPPQYRDGHRNGLKHYLSSGEGPVLKRLIEMSALRRDGSEFPIELSISPIVTDNVVTFCGFITDISERKKAEEEILSFNQRLEQKVIERTNELEVANKELEAFSYSVSHDLRAPLRSIHGYMNIFSEEYSEKVDDEGRRFMAIILHNSLKMGELIDDLLAFSQLGRKELIRRDIAMTDVVRSIWEEQTRAEGARDISFTLHDLHSAPADLVTIRQAWSNLIGNALKYSGNREKTIIEIGSTDKGDHVVYFIKDNGAGFDMKYYSQLFGVFQRLHSVKDFDGTGVGLAIVHRIITKHGGTIWAEGKPDAGATFYFSLMKE
jgi:PAS domain S-box-containing protein